MFYIRAGFEIDNICFIEKDAHALTSDYDCFWRSWDQGGELVCYRNVENKVIQNYITTYDKNSAKNEAIYLETALKCLSSNATAARTQSTTMPLQLALFAEFDLAFSLSPEYGSSGGTRIEHGFATTSDNGDDVPFSAIEYIHIIANVPELAPSGNVVDVNNWSIDIDEMRLYDETFNNHFKSQGVQAHMDALGFDIRSGSSIEKSLDEKLGIIEKLQMSIVRSFQSAGFRRIASEEFEEYLGMNEHELIEQIEKQRPTGVKKIAPIKLGPNIFVVVNESSARCTRGSRGTLFAFINSIQPTPYVKSDFGNVSFQLSAIGNCADTKNRTTHKYLRQLHTDASNSLLNELKQY